MGRDRTAIEFHAYAAGFLARAGTIGGDDVAKLRDRVTHLSESDQLRVEVEAFCAGPGLPSPSRGLTLHEALDHLKLAEAGEAIRRITGE